MHLNMRFQMSCVFFILALIRDLRYIAEVMKR